MYFATIKSNKTTDLQSKCQIIVVVRCNGALRDVTVYNYSESGNIVLSNGKVRCNFNGIGTNEDNLSDVLERFNDSFVVEKID